MIESYVIFISCFSITYAACEFANNRFSVMPRPIRIQHRPTSFISRISCCASLEILLNSNYTVPTSRYKFLNCSEINKTFVLISGLTPEYLLLRQKVPRTPAYIRAQRKSRRHRDVIETSGVFSGNHLTQNTMAKKHSVRHCTDVRAHAQTNCCD